MSSFKISGHEMPWLNPSPIFRSSLNCKSMCFKGRALENDKKSLERMPRKASEARNIFQATVAVRAAQWELQINILSLDVYCILFSWLTTSYHWALGHSKPRWLWVFVPTYLLLDGHTSWRGHRAVYTPQSQITLDKLLIVLLKKRGSAGEAFFGKWKDAGVTKSEQAPTFSLWEWNQRMIQTGRRAARSREWRVTRFQFYSWLYPRLAMWPPASYFSASLPVFPSLKEYSLILVL